MYMFCHITIHFGDKECHVSISKRPKNVTTPIKVYFEKIYDILFCGWNRSSLYYLLI